MSDWSTIESDPGVFTALLHQIGVRNVDVRELVDLSPEGLHALPRVLGLVFLFKWQKDASHKFDEGTRSDGGRLLPYVPELYFAQQRITNACATQALVNVMLNADLDTHEDGVRIEAPLSEFKEFTKDLPPDLRGEMLQHSDSIREAHNSFRRADAFFVERDHDDDSSGADPFHFVAFTPKNGRVYELDGLQSGPVDLGEADDWLVRAADVIGQRMQHYQGELRFTLLALVASDYAKWCRQRDLLKSSNEDSSELPHLEMLIHEHEEKHRLFEEENRRRKHNYVPFMFALLRELAKANELEFYRREKGLINVAQQQQQQRQRQQS